MNPVALENYLVVGAILFALGLIGFLARRNLIIMFLCVEMMLQGVALNLVAFARYRGNLGGQVLTLFILTVAACEAAIALALVLMLYRRKRIARRQRVAGAARGGPGAGRGRGAAARGAARADLAAPAARRSRAGPSAARRRPMSSAAISG